jgi:hypothetical protein
MLIQANSGYHCTRQMAIYDNINLVSISKIGEKEEFSMKFAIWAPKKRQNGKNQLVRQIRKKSWKSNKKQTFL